VDGADTSQAIELAQLNLCYYSADPLGCRHAMVAEFPYQVIQANLHVLGGSVQEVFNPCPAAQVLYSVIMGSCCLVLATSHFMHCATCRRIQVQSIVSARLAEPSREGAGASTCEVSVASDGGPPSPVFSCRSQSAYGPL
jgi:hypothetical protein